LGLIDDFAGRFGSQAHTGRLNAESSAAFVLDGLAQTTPHIFVMQDGARSHPSKAREEFVAAHATRLTKVQWPAYAPDCNPLEYLGKKVKKMATHLKHFPAFTRLQAEGDNAWRHFTQTSHEIMAWMTRSWDSLGALAA
jgi:DDE superfamily endonuclease